jgi:hypothetical protein
MAVLLRGGILVLWFGFGLPNSLAPAADDPPRVITDSPDYCRQLRLMVEEVVRQTTAPPWGVEGLTEEGGRMCDQGRVRGGIVRLRRALMMLRTMPSSAD